MSVPLHHFYHIYADGDWEGPVSDHLRALRCDGLMDELTTFGVGLVGTDENRQAVKEYLIEAAPRAFVADEAVQGWEQVTLLKLHEFTKNNDGYISYAHTKGAAHFAEVNVYWRKSMEWYNFCQWREPVRFLDLGVKIVGCHWHAGGEAANPSWGTGGMFGGNYWWSSCEVLRHAPDVETTSRHAAEHWIGRLSEVMDLSYEVFIHDLNPEPIAAGYLKHKW